MYGSVFNNTEQKWEIRTNAKLYEPYKREDVVQFSIYHRDKDRMGRPCMAGRCKYVGRSIEKYDEGKVTAKNMEGQRQGIIRRNWSGLGAGI